MKKSLKLNAVLNLLQSVMSVIFPLITFPYVARIFGVEQLGSYNFSKNLVEMFSYIAMLGIPTYAAREGARVRENRKQISKLNSEVFSINVISTILVLLTLYLITFLFSVLASYKNLILIFSITIPMTTVGMSWLFVIYEDYVFTSVLSILVNLFSIICMFLFVKTKEDVGVYALITVIAACGSSLIKFFYGRKYCDTKVTLNIDYRRHLKPICLMFSAYLSVMIYNKTDTALLGLMCSDYHVGIYSVSTKVYSLVKACLLSIASVLQTRAVIWAASDDTRAKETYLSKCFNMLIVFVIPCMVGMAFMQHDIIELTAGNSYYEAGSSMIILSVALFFALFSTFYSSCVLNPNNKEMITFNGALAGALINLGLNFIAIPLLKEDGAALTTLIAEITVFAIYLIKTWRYFHHIGVGTVILKTVLSSIGIVIVLLLLNNWEMHIIVRIIFKISLAGIVYWGLQILLKNNVVVEVCRNMIKYIRSKIQS